MQRVRHGSICDICFFDLSQRTGCWVQKIQNKITKALKDIQFTFVHENNLNVRRSGWGDRRGRIGRRDRKEKREHCLLHSDNKQTLKSLVLKFRDSWFQVIAYVHESVVFFVQTKNQESGMALVFFLRKFRNYKQGLKDFECHTSCKERYIGMNTHICDSEMKTDELSSVLASSHEETQVTLAKNRNAVTFQGRWGFRGLVSGEENLHSWL